MRGSFNLQVKAALEYVLSLPVNVIDNVAASQLLFDGNPMNFIFFYTLFLVCTHLCTNVSLILS